jgi:hypothetical protein
VPTMEAGHEGSTECQEECLAHRASLGSVVPPCHLAVPCLRPSLARQEVEQYLHLGVFATEGDSMRGHQQVSVIKLIFISDIMDIFPMIFACYEQQDLSVSMCPPPTPRLL